MKKRFLWILLFVFFFLGLRVHAAPITYTRTSEYPRLPSDIDVSRVNMDEVLKTPSVDPSAKIYDFADLLTDAEEAKIYNQLSEYINNTGLDAVIVITDDLAGFQMNQYTYYFYDYNDFKDDGVAFVIYVNGGSPSIFMGNNGPKTSKVFEAYTDKRIAAILKHIYTEHISSGDYAGACEKYIQLVDGFFVSSFGDYKIGEEGEVVKVFPWVGVIVISFVVSFILLILIVSKYQRPHTFVDNTIKKSVNPATMIVKCEYDKLSNGNIEGGS